MSRGEDDGELEPTLASPPVPRSGSLAGAAELAETEVSLPGEATRANELVAGVSIGRYQLGRRLGAGAMGEVWAAFDPQLERTVAIKLVHPNLARTPEVAARMLREARAMAKLSHRAVVAIHDAGEEDGRLFLAMELVSGTTLGAVLRARTPDERSDWRRWLTMMLDAGRGLAAAHSAGVLHRDFKPDNVLVDDRGRVCVGDFGLASLGAAARARPSEPSIGPLAPDPELTTTGSLLGTPAYMSLEQLEASDVDARADQFSFCVATYEALYGTRPFVAPGAPTSVIALAAAIADGAIQPPPAGTEVPAAVRALVVRGLAADREARWPDLDALLAELARELTPAVSVDPTAPMRRPRGQRHVLAIGGAVALAAVLAVALVIGVGRKQEASRLAPPLAEVAQPVARMLWPVPLRASFALSPGGGRIAIGTDRLEVRDLDTGKIWSNTPRSPGRVWFNRIDFAGEDVVRWQEAEAWDRLHGWSYADGAERVDLINANGALWVGGMTEGQLVTRKAPDGVSKELAVIRDQQTVARWPFSAKRIDLAGFAPSRHRFAYFDADRFAGRVVVIDAATGKSYRSERIVEPTGLAWLRDDLLVYATAAARPVIVTRAVTSDGVGEPRVLYRLRPDGWAGALLVSARRFLYVENAPVTRTRVLDRDTASVRDFEPTVAAVPLGWTADGAFLIWNRTSGKLERHADPAPVELVDVRLDGEPANATFAGDLLIVSQRGIGGRELVAVSLETGKQAWRHPVGASLAARCAGDRSEPCFVARRAGEAEEPYEIVRIDPRTGQTSGAPIYTGAVEDLAVRADGERILVVNGSGKVQELDRKGAVTSELELPVPVIRSVAYDPRGGTLVGVTVLGNSYAIGRHDGTSYSVLSQTDGAILSLIRPSPTGGKILALGRSLSSDLWELKLPAAP